MVLIKMIKYKPHLLNTVIQIQTKILN